MVIIVEQTEELTAHTINSTGIITLTRARALNALSLGMIRLFKKILDFWQTDSQIAHVIIRSGDNRAFCAGGDIRAVYEAIRAKIPNLSQYFAEEYAVNLQIATYPKPITVLIDGYVMGGGVGISIHAQNRVATLNAVWAMPETAIGFMPDIGASYFLNQMPHYIGRYLGMTSHRIGLDDGVFVGAHTHTIPREQLEQVFEVLCNSSSPAEILVPHLAKITPCDLQRHSAEIEAYFSAQNWRDVIRNLENAAPSSLFATRTLETLKTRCPTSVAVAFEMLKITQGMRLAECLQHETRIAQLMIDRSDFCEGVRAVVVDKDNSPNWQPCDFSHINDEEIYRIVYATHSFYTQPLSTNVNSG